MRRSIFCNNEIELKMRLEIENTHGWKTVKNGFCNNVYYAIIEKKKECGILITKQYHNKCPICGTEFVSGNTRRKYCSKTCRSKEQYLEKSGIL